MFVSGDVKQKQHDVTSMKKSYISITEGEKGKMNRTKRKTLWLLSLLVLLVLPVFAMPRQAEAANNKKISSYSVTINNKNVKKKKYTMNSGTSVAIKTTVKPAKALKSVTYKSGNSKVAKVDRQGKITALKKGVVKITITLKARNGKKQSTWVKVKVNGVDTSKIKTYAVTNDENNAKKKTITLEKGKNTYLKVDVNPTQARKSVSFKSSNKKIATVSGSGKIKAKKEGTAKITITIKAKNGKKYMTWVKIKVVKVNNTRITGYTVTSAGNNVDKQRLTLDKGDSTKIDVAVTPAVAAKSIVMTSDNPAAVGVDNAGNISARAAGNARITITMTPKEGTVQITYVDVSVMEVIKYCLLMEKGTTSPVQPDGFNGNLTATSSNPAIINVVSTNTLHANAYGTCEVIVTGMNQRAYITMTVPDVSNSDSGAQLSLPSMNSGWHTFTVFKQAARTYNEYSEFLAGHGCANCTLTNMIRAYAPAYATATPDSVIATIERQVAGEEAWTENHVTKVPEKQSPLSMYGISQILSAAGVRNTYVTKFNSSMKDSSDGNATEDIIAHLKTGNPVVYEARDYNRYTGSSDGRWTGNYHTLSLIGYFVDGRVLLTDTAGRGWYKPANGYYGGQRFKIVDLKDAMSHMFSCENKPNTIYFKGTTKAGGYIKVNP